jgi:hypothetical protein
VIGRLQGIEKCRKKSRQVVKNDEQVMVFLLWMFKTRTTNPTRSLSTLKEAHAHRRTNGLEEKRSQPITMLRLHLLQGRQPPFPCAFFISKFPIP